MENLNLEEIWDSSEYDQREKDIDLWVMKNNKAVSIENKIISKQYKNIIIETKSSIEKNTEGWIYKSEADLLAWFAIEDQEITEGRLFSLPQLREWWIIKGAFMEFLTRKGETYTTKGDVSYHTEIKIIPNKRIPKKTIIFWKRKDKIIIDKREKGFENAWVKKPEVKMEAPPDGYVHNILQKAYPTATFEKHTEKYWVINWKKNRQTPLYIVNDSLINTGKIRIHQKLRVREEAMQLTISYPTHKNKYLILYNWLTPSIKNNNVIEINNIKHRIYEIHPNLANPSFDYFTEKHDK